jgi:membrane protein
MTTPTTETSADTTRVDRVGEDRYLRSVRRMHGADGWLLEWMAPLRHVRIGSFSVGDVAETATFCLRHLREDRAPQIAATLAFRTLFGLVPVLVVVTLAAKAMLGDGFKSAMLSLFTSIGMANVRLNVASDEGDVSTTIGLDQWMSQLVDHASGLSVAALGWTGFVLVAFSAIWVLITIEEAFNTIFRCEYGRSWVRRVLVYWFILTVGPLALAFAPLLLAWVGAMTATLESWAWLAWIGRLLLSVSILWLSLFVAYITIPATSVAWRPAMIGALVGAILLEIGKRSFGLYLQNAFGISALYGSLGLIPLFMFWVYLMWLVILFGAEVAALLQAIRRRERAGTPQHVVDAEAFVRTLALVADHFRKGETTSFAELADAVRLPSPALSLVVDRLEDAGFLRRVGDADALTLGRPADSIPMRDVLAIAWRQRPVDATVATQPRSDTGSVTVAHLRSAQADAVGDRTLADALAAGSPQSRRV